MHLINGFFSDLLTSAIEGARRLKVSINEQLIDGNKAITVQEFTELNIKNGAQFYARAAWPIGNSIAAGQSKLLYFETGAIDVLVKDRLFNYSAEELKLEIFANPSGVTGGTPVNVSNWNGVSPNETTIVSVLRDVTTTSNGTLIQDPEYFFGANATGHRDQSGIPEGYERLVAGNTGYIVAITNTGSGAARCQYGLSWYEGAISVNVPLDF